MDEDREAGEGLNSGGADALPGTAGESVRVEFDGGPDGDEAGDVAGGDEAGQQPVKRGRGRPRKQAQAEEKQSAEKPRVLKFDADPEPVTPRKRTPAAKKSAAQEMEVAAGMLTATAFALMGALKGDHWNLTGSELSKIAPPLAQVLASLPGKQAKKAQKIVNDLSAPIALVVAVSAAVKPRIAQDMQATAKKRQAAEQDKGRAKDELPRQPSPNRNAPAATAAGTGQGGTVTLDSGAYADAVPGGRVVGL